MTEETRASDAEREQAVGRLRDASAEGRLTLEELAERTAFAYHSRTHGELERVTQDLPPAAPQRSRRKPVRWTIALIGDAKRRGRWRAARRTRVVLGIGDCELDLREAELEGDEIDVTAVLGIGDVKVIVPRHVDVELGGFVLIGDRKERGATDVLPPDAPFVRVRVFGLIADVKIDRR